MPLSDSHCTGASAYAAETRFRAGQHKIAHHLAGAPARPGHSGDHLAVMGVHGEVHPHNLTVPAADRQPTEDQRWF